MPFACLMAWDMLRYVAQNQDKTTDPGIELKIKEATKIALTRTGYLWLIYKVEGTQSIALPIYRNDRRIPRASRTKLDRATTKIWKNLGVADCECCTKVHSTQATQQSKKASPWVLEIQKASNFITAMVPDTEAFGKPSKWAELQKQEMAESYKGKTVFKDKKTGVWHCETPNGFRIIVPERFRRALCERYHKLLLHAGVAKTKNSLMQNFTWPTIAKDTKTWVQACNVCTLIKATKRLCDMRFSARINRLPRTHYAMDYLGVAKNSQGYCNVLAIIDLMSKAIVLKATKSADGVTTADIFYEHIIAKRGVPLSVRSDSAKAFVGQAMTKLKTDFGISSVDTKGYNPTGNATCERVFRWINKVFRAMSANEYTQWHKYIPLMALAWNSMYHDSIGCTPFEIETGTKCRNIAHALFEDTSWAHAKRSDEVLDLATVRAAVQSFKCLANLTTMQMKREEASRLNSRGREYQAYKVGDHVSYYKPKPAAQLQKLNRKPKHALFWSGPARITQINGNIITLEDVSSGVTYVRAKQLLRPYKAVGNGQLEDTQSSVSVMKSETVALRDDDDQDTKVYWLADVRSLEGDLITVHYRYTTQKDLGNAQFRKAYHSSIPEKFFANPRARQLQLRQIVCNIPSH